ncbi:MAG: DUF3179 domain-containing protein [Deltaproteobacteria bacterium]|nr:DUF3179 domain-containing protein [Deltaproteobacteria bacterium]
MTRAGLVCLLFVGLGAVLCRPALIPAAGAVLAAGAAISAGEGAQRAASASELNGFSLAGLTAPREQLIAGGPARDGIHSVDAPRFAAPEDARWVRADTPVIGVALGGVAHAYPVHVMEYHQVVNDVIGGVPVVVTYDPITDMAAAWRARSGEEALVFGVSGLVYRSSFVLYDRQRESLWSPFDGRALSGPLAGDQLSAVRSRVEPMAVWLAREPGTRVLELPERMKVDYRHSPYSAYWASKDVPFPLDTTDDRFHAKELVLGVEAEGRARAYIGSVLTGAGARIVDDIGAARIRIEYDGSTGTFRYQAPESVRVTSGYWFAWKNLHPDTEVWHPGSQRRSSPSHDLTISPSHY